MRKRRRVPEVLWRIFRNRARTLADTVITLTLPVPPEQECLCRGRLCLACIENAMSFLIRPDDPPDYHKLLFECFVVISDSAPPLSRFDHDNRWSQNMIVPDVIESIVKERLLPSNVICSGYDVWSRGSPIVKQLTSPAWVLLLGRVGDDLMVYLLKYGFIFLPSQHKRHCQVAGPSIVDCASTLSSQKEKRRNYEMILRQEHQLSNYFVPEISSSSVTCYCCDHNTLAFRTCRHLQSNVSCTSSYKVLKTCRNERIATYCQASNIFEHCCGQMLSKRRRHPKMFSWQRRKKCRLLSKLDIRADISSREENFKASTPSSTGETRRTRKRSRQFCWQRRKLRRKSNLEANFLEPCAAASFGLMNVKEMTKINKQPIFYSLECSPSIFPSTHVLYSLKPNNLGASLLLRDIFGLSEPYCRCRCSSGQRCWYHSLLKFLKTLIRRTHYCQHLSLLDKHCAVSSIDRNTINLTASMFEKTFEDYDVPSVSSKSYCSKNQVISFIWAACRNLIPRELLGNVSSWRCLRRNIGRFITLRRYENFSLKQCLKRLKISDFPILCDNMLPFGENKQVLRNVMNNSGAAKDSWKSEDMFERHKYERLKSWMCWFFSNIVVPMVKTNFYVTESQHGKKDVFYYRKSIWERLANETVTNLTDQNHQLLDAASVWNIIRGRSLGFSRLRLCPKLEGVRALANLSASSTFSMPSIGTRFNGPEILKMGARRNNGRKYRSLNHVLKDIHAILTGLRWKEPESLGSSVFDYNDVYKKLSPFVYGLRRRSTCPIDVFIVVADVMNAFDFIDHDMLLAIMQDVLTKDTYTLKLSWQVVCRSNSMSVLESRRLVDEGFCEGTPAALPGVLVAEEKVRNFGRQELYSTLKEHLKHNIVQFKKKFYMQNVGIPQGSVLSTLLCSFYYGHMENNLIVPFCEKSCEQDFQRLSGNSSMNAYSSKCDDDLEPASNFVLLRFIDDFLFISPSKKQAESFLFRLQRGFRKYKCYMNEKKFSINFTTLNSINHSAEKVCVGTDGILFIRWSGLLINFCTLEIQADYTRYLNNHLRSTLTVRWFGKPLKHLDATLCAFMRPKCHAIFYDSNMNSAAVVRLNIYQVFLLSAMKFHCYIRSLSEICSLQAAFSMVMIVKSLRYMEKLIKRRVVDMKSRYNMHPRLQLERGEVIWLGLNAFIAALKKKQSSHKELISLLTEKLSSHKLRGGISLPLKYSIDPSHSSILWSVRY